MSDEEYDWVFESLVGFLKGPIWNAPIMTFIEEKSVVFEPEQEIEEEYQKIYEEYKNMVDFMLGSHMEDLGITAEQFDNACGKTNKNIHSQFHQSLFEQIWAANDYEIFKRMMTKKNIELQLQALEVLAQKYGLLPESLLPPEEQPSDQEKAVMREIIKKTVEDATNEKLREERESKEMEMAIQATMAEKARLEAEAQKEKELLEKAIQLSLKESRQQIIEPSTESSNKYDSYIAVCPQKIDEEDAKLRQEYLRKQRDRLLALKKQERQKQLKQYEKLTNERPKSARAAKTVVDEEEKPNLDPEMLAFRRSLAARLKSEVIGDRQ